MQIAVSSSQRRNGYVLDSYALLAYLEAEPGSNRIRELLETAKKTKLTYTCV